MLYAHQVWNGCTKHSHVSGIYRDKRNHEADLDMVIIYCMHNHIYASALSIYTATRSYNVRGTLASEP